MKFTSNLFFTDIDFCKPEVIRGLELSLSLLNKVPRVPECLSAQVPFECPSALSARVPQVLKFLLSARVPQVSKFLECPSAQVPSSVLSTLSA